MEFYEEQPADAAVTRALGGLKREGGLVFVVGGATSAHAAVCGRFLGDDADRQVVARTDGTTGGTGHAENPAAVVEHPVTTRRATRPTDASTAKLGTVVDDLEEAMAEHAGASGLRVCLDSVLPFIDGLESGGLDHLASLRETARETGSVVHVHFPAMRTAVPERHLEAADATVEVETRSDGPYQRWWLPGRGDPTGWVRI